jgi:hypothetical protein
VLAVRRRRPRPQLLSIDRHITQGGVCIRSLRWDPAALVLGSTLDLTASVAFVATLHVPPGYRLQQTAGNAEPLEESGETLRLRVRNGSWECRFAKEAGK